MLQTKLDLVGSNSVGYKNTNKVFHIRRMRRAAENRWKSRDIPSECGASISSVRSKQEQYNKHHTFQKFISKIPSTLYIF